MRHRFLIMILSLLLANGFDVLGIARPNPHPSISAKVKAMKKYDGFFSFYWDEESGKLWLEIDKWEKEFLYIIYLAAGVGSNALGLDRGQLGRTRIVKFQRIGSKVLLIQPNYSFRAISDRPQERKAVQEAFAQSVLWGFKVAAEEAGRVLVDATPFFLRDAYGVAEVLRRTRQGNYRLDTSRTALYLARTKNFPQNTEVEVTLTFTADSPGRLVQEVVPTPEAITVRQHHSFVRLPDSGYTPRAFDPRAGFNGIQFMDFATPIGEPIVKRWIVRHRLKKKDPGLPVSVPVKPIVYYVDAGTPEPIRSALMEGAGWWNEAFEAAGFKDAFQVKILPPEVDPMDIRYNVIQWVHRSTRGWSYGSSVIDPRTGEIIKGHILLGSLRVRQDFLIAQGLLAPYEEGKPVPPDMQEMALARLRQLAAHEVGHTLGLAHNFAASASQRASVMDYPHPFVQLKDDGTLDLSQAYATGIGEWDRMAIQYGYQEFPDAGSERMALKRIIEEALSRGLIFISDPDARPSGGAHPIAHLWDNGKDAVAELNRLMKIRAQALKNFSQRNIPVGAPLTTLEEVLVPVYLFHRYQLQATAKVLGGLYYTYALRGDGQIVTGMIPPSRQWEAFRALLRTIQPEALRLPPNILRLIPPRAFGYTRHRELFPSHTGVTFDPLSAAESAAHLTVRLMLNSQRAARLVEYHAWNKQYPGFEEIVDRLLKATWKSYLRSTEEAEIQRVVNHVVLYHLMALAADTSALPQVRAIAFYKLDELKKWLEKRLKVIGDKSYRAHYVFAINQIERFQTAPEKVHLTAPMEPPPGQPIGSDDDAFFGLDDSLP